MVWSLNFVTYYFWPFSAISMKMRKQTTIIISMNTISMPSYSLLIGLPDIGLMISRVAHFETIIKLAIGIEAFGVLDY